MLWRRRSAGIWASLSLSPLLSIPLHRSGITDRGVVWILAELAPAAALAQQIPALIERRSQHVQSVLFHVGEAVLVEQLMLLGDELIDVFEDVLVGHGNLPRG
jgi:hypothetical protein